MTIRKQSFMLLVALIHCSKLGLGQRQQTSQVPIPIAFQEKPEDDVRRQNANNRLPFFVPGRCRDNELLFPGDQTDDWICDCVPGFIFHPTSDMCHEAFKQGPCSDGEYLILRRAKVIPECAQNPCPKDGQVPIKGTCYELGKSDPCANPELSYVLGVNTTTLEITCVKLSMTPESTMTPKPNATLETRFGEEAVKDPRSTLDFKSLPICAAGCRRAINGTCPREEQNI